MISLWRLESMGKDKPDERPLPLYLFLIIRNFAGICLTVIAKCVSALKIQLSSEIAVGQSKSTVYYFLVVTVVQYNSKQRRFLPGT